jgi:hemolysin activation/secretion protein
VQAIAEAMTRRYREAGYLLSRVILPAEQGTLDPANARIRLLALEGYIGAVRFTGDAALVARFRAYWADAEARLMAQKPLKHADFEREMLLVSDLSGIEVSSRFEEAGADGEGKAEGEAEAKAGGPGASLLILELREKPLEGSISLGNSGTKSAGRGLLTVSAGFSWPLVGSHSAVSYTQARERDEYAAWSFSHTHRFANGLSANASLAESRSPKPDSDFARAFDYETESRTFSAGVNYPLLRGRDRNLSVASSYEHRNGRSDLLDAPYTCDRLRSLTLEANFDFSDAIGEGGVTQIIPSVTRGMDWFDATNRAPDASSPLAPARFTRYRLYLSRTQNLPRGFSLVGNFSAQVADAPLTSYSRESLGGSQFGRGYAPGVIENDNGLAASLEAEPEHQNKCLS